MSKDYEIDEAYDLGVAHGIKEERARIKRELEEWMIGDFPREDAGLYNSRRIVNEIERICAGVAIPCAWREDADGNWHTDCGHIFCFNDDGPIKNGFKFCGYCGSDLKEEPFSEDARMPDPDNPGTETQERR